MPCCPQDFPDKNTGVHFLLQGIFLTQGSNPHPPHCRLPCNPVIPRLAIHRKELKTGFQIKTCTQMFTAALFTTDKRWKQPRCPLTDEWMNETWSIHTMELSHNKAWNPDTRHSRMSTRNTFYVGKAPTKGHILWDSAVRSVQRR